jgi:hypothetical protein
MWWYLHAMESMRRAVRRCYSVEAELAFVALVLIAWQAARIPIEGTVGVSLAHARSVVGLEETLRLDVEPWVVGVAAGSALETALAWVYANVHLPVLFGFMAAFRVLAPDRYPRIRTTFVVSFLPAILVIGLYPLAPPHWLPELGLGGPPTDAELTASGAVFHNATAAAASQHFGFAAFVAATSIWLLPRSRLAWATLAYPALVFVVIVGTGNHYVLDCVIGTLTFVFGALVASLVHGGASAAGALPSVNEAVRIGVGYALIAWGFHSLDLTSLRGWETGLPWVLVAAVGIACVLAPRVSAQEPIAESR